MFFSFSSLVIVLIFFARWYGLLLHIMQPAMKFFPRFGFLMFEKNMTCHVFLFLEFILNLIIYILDERKIIVLIIKFSNF